MDKTAFVTGAIGFLGKPGCGICSARKGSTVIQRSTSNLEYLEAFNIEQKLGSIEDYQSVLQAMPTTY